MNNGNPYGVWSFLSQSDGVGIAVLIILLVMSIASWYLILLKAIRGMQVRRRASAFLERFWNSPSFESIASALASRTPEEPFGRVAWQSIEALRHFRKSTGAGLAEAAGEDEFVTRAIRRAINRETAALESGLTVLASVGSTAPFVGLFGTVWGIYHALIGIGASGKATLDTVAGPVGEALIMTAAGLAVAIPAVLGYNAFVRQNRVVLAELDGFAHDLHSFLMVGARPHGTEGRAHSAPAGAVATPKTNPGVA
jgi:biopolymer transport protein ExbB